MWVVVPYLLTLLTDRLDSLVQRRVACSGTCLLMLSLLCIAELSRYSLETSVSGKSMNPVACVHRGKGFLIGRYVDLVAYLLVSSRLGRLVHVSLRITTLSTYITHPIGNTACDRHAALACVRLRAWGLDPYSGVHCAIYTCIYEHRDGRLGEAAGWLTRHA